VESGDLHLAVSFLRGGSAARALPGTNAEEHGTLKRAALEPWSAFGASRQAGLGALAAALGANALKGRGSLREETENPNRLTVKGEQENREVAERHAGCA